MCVFITQILIPLTMTLIGAWVGVWLGIRHSKRIEKIRFAEERSDILTALLYSLEENHNYIEQIENLHFPSDEIPSFPLDTVALAHVSLNSRKYLPEGTSWAERYNKLRFELDHINRKFLLFYIRPSQQGLDGVKVLISQAKAMLSSEIDTLKKMT